MNTQMLHRLILSIVVSSIILLSAGEIPLVFDENKIDVGTMYVYEYSANKEDFEPTSKGYLYIKTLNDIEIIWIGIKDTMPTLMEMYKMNWNYMMFEKKEFIRLINKNDIPINATLKSQTSNDFSKRITKYIGTNRYEDGFKEKTSFNKFNSIPTYFYRKTDLMPLWFVLRFYPLEKEKISVNSVERGYNVKFYIKYEGKEKVETPYGKVLSYKFELVPELSFWMKLIYSPKKAFIWLTTEDESRYMVKYRNNNVRSTFTRNMEYRLAEIKKMTPEEWEALKQSYEN